MSRPILTVISGDEWLIHGLRTGQGERFELLVESDIESLQQRDSHGPFAALVVDARQTVDGGHEFARVLEQLADDPENRHIILLTGDDCPEPLERQAAERQVTHIRGSVVPSHIVATILNFGPAAMDDVNIAPSSPEVASSDRKDVAQHFATNSAKLKSMLDDLSIAADHDVTILLIGETGSGKTHLSNLIHETSHRRGEPFLHVACGALPRDLIESELFGHVKGAFTSAHADKQGKFLAAGKGTILLDEIDVLGPEQQVKLLRVIETGEFEPVGSNETHRSRARLIVASNLDLQPLVDQGRFRPDLYYRLNMLKFEIPPLRKRPMDVVPLAKGFIRKFQDKHGVAIARVEDSMLDALTGYPWPGNIRELENVIQRAVIYCRDGILTSCQLPDHIVAGAAGPTNDPTVRLDGYRPATRQTLGRQVAMTEREIIEQALFQNDQSKTKTAKALGISRVTLYNKLKKLEISS